MVDTHGLKTRLEEEKTLLEAELGSIAKRDPQNPNDWVPTSGNVQADTAEETEVADELEELGTNAAIASELEVRYQNVLRALQKMEEGTYGICEISGEPIEEDRLKANPAARTCKAHMDDEDRLPK